MLRKSKNLLEVTDMRKVKKLWTMVNNFHNPYTYWLNRLLKFKIRHYACTFNDKLNIPHMNYSRIYFKLNKIMFKCNLANLS